MRYNSDDDLPMNQVVSLYQANGWSAATKPDLLMSALKHSHFLVSAWDGDQLVGIGNAISDGFLVVYYPHLIVRPEYQGKGVGTEIMRRLKERYQGFHQQMLAADGGAIEFYRKNGFERAGKTECMWIYSGKDH